MDQRPDLSAGPQPAAAVDTPAGQPVARVFDERQRELLARVLDRIVPAHDDVPGAGALGVGSSIEATLTRSAPLRLLFLDGLLTIDIAAGPAGFVTQEASALDGTLARVEAASPAFFAALVHHAYRGYYTHPTVLRALERATGYPARPPQPLGHRIEPWDEKLLDRQRERAPFWRRAD
jgi:hypothetical protein